jgi:hypothetical protein
VNSIFIRRGPCPNKFTQKYLSIFLSSYIKLTYVLIINYGIIIKSISTLMHTVWYDDKCKITFKLVINWTNEILKHTVVSSGLSQPGIIDARAQYRDVAQRLRNTGVVNACSI